ncbi:MAG: carbon monoxide dehydrogenase [Hyphomicrobiales bacterium]|nr:MAG: carbon monoxide dehydrogenase [Hyphomicrobiales bacterium]
MLASMAISLMASFTGLALTRGLSFLPETKRKIRIVMASIALGGGIWSMHFVAMLGLKLPILFYYDALTTMISALVAILMAGVALLVMHFRKRTTANIAIAGTIVGLGIPTMHYLGMSGMQLCSPIYTPLSVILPVIASIILGMVSFAIAYGERTRKNILLGTVTFGVAIFLVHFLAMAGTNFVQFASVSDITVSIDNGSLALVVAVISFLICGAFLLSGATFLPTANVVADEITPKTDPEIEAEKTNAHPDADTLETTKENTEATANIPVNLIPYQKNGQTQFVPLSEVAAVRAEGHYSILYVGAQKLFCQWTISTAEERLPEENFIRCHRSYLINPNHVSGFERKKDNGICLFDNNPGLGPVPVSRSRMNEVRQVLGLT